VQALGAALLAAVACAVACMGQADGYQGPLPTSAARTACLNPLRGRVFAPPAGVLGGEELEFRGFVVGADPLACFVRAGEPDGARVFVPLYVDADCAALFALVTGERMPAYEGRTSAGYRAAVAPSAR
jgi:hypothetical protein